MALAHRMFQWSHDFSDMVSDSGEVLIGDSHLSTAFQWSHDFSVMISSTSATQFNGDAAFQWSHDFSVMVRNIFLKLSQL